MSGCRAHGFENGSRFVLPFSSAARIDESMSAENSAECPNGSAARALRRWGPSSCKRTYGDGTFDSGPLLPRAFARVKSQARFDCTAFTLDEQRVAPKLPGWGRRWIRFEIESAESARAQEKNDLGQQRFAFLVEISSCGWRVVAAS